jgi:cell division protein FtsA
MIEVPGVGERGVRQMSRHTLAEVVEPRVEEIYNLVLAELKNAGFADRLASGSIVITGGAAQMPGMVELAEEIFHMPARLGLPRYVGGLAEVVKSPRYSTAVGLLLVAREQLLKNPAGRAREGSLGGMLGRVKTWFQTNF